MGLVHNGQKCTWLIYLFILQPNKHRGALEECTYNWFGYIMSYPHSSALPSLKHDGFVFFWVGWNANSKRSGGSEAPTFRLIFLNHSWIERPLDGLKMYLNVGKQFRFVFSFLRLAFKGCTKTNSQLSSGVIMWHFGVKIQKGVSRIQRFVPWLCFQRPEHSFFFLS